MIFSSLSLRVFSSGSLYNGSEMRELDIDVVHARVGGIWTLGLVSISTTDIVIIFQTQVVVFVVAQTCRGYPRWPVLSRFTTIAIARVHMEATNLIEDSFLVHNLNDSELHTFSSNQHDRLWILLAL
ncbi:hypothetical protein KCU90_g39, partial [Aureobasidium melanogenum]